MDILSHSGDIRDQSRRLHEIDRNFACFWPPFCFFGGGVELPEFLESIYKVDTGSDHVAKFRGDRPRELGDYALNQNLTRARSTAARSRSLCAVGPIRDIGH